MICSRYWITKIGSIKCRLIIVVLDVFYLQIITYYKEGSGENWFHDAIQERNAICKRCSSSSVIVVGLKSKRVLSC